jgi:hypothetical protein
MHLHLLRWRLAFRPALERLRRLALKSRWRSTGWQRHKKHPHLQPVPAFSRVAAGAARWRRVRGKLPATAAAAEAAARPALPVPG